LGKANVASGAVTITILFISLSAAQYNLDADWAEVGTEVILRRCPICVQDSIVGHGRRRKQAHDEHHDWIGIRRGLCNRCGKTFTFLPPFSPLCVARTGPDVNSAACTCPIAGDRSVTAWYNG
jgi:hypothetical protein